jgi:predicted ATPase/class 3 adenylate cyclase
MPMPSGATVFLFTDIEGSTRLWEERPNEMREALAAHDGILRAAIEGNNGQVFKTIGDAFCAAFNALDDAISAARHAQTALNQLDSEPAGLQLRVRMAIHAGRADERDGDYFGPAVNRVARLLSVGHGGQTLLSEAAQSLIYGSSQTETSVKLLDLGFHNLQDISEPEHIFQICFADLQDEFPPLRSLIYLRHNLPLQVTSFVGREREIADVKKGLHNSRLLTITGAGGVGKTRLVVQVAFDAVSEYPDGVWMAELSPVGDPDRVPHTIAQALGVREESGKSLTDSIVKHLKAKRLLLVLDNCEHVLDVCSSLANEIIRSCPGVTIAATSREPLSISGEKVFTMPALSCPRADAATSNSNLYEYEAVKLFAERAQSVSPGFQVMPANASAVIQVCRRLDGIPLALELAAARVRVMPVEQIASRLDDRFRLLTGGSRTALPRQQTLRALIDWSYELLSAEEKTLLNRLSVFAGGWTLDAAEAVCADEQADGIEAWQVLDLLASLVGKSLVIFDESGATARYRLLETVRHYALERLIAGDDEEAIRRRHAEWCRSLVIEAGTHLSTPQQPSWLARMDAEHDNVQSALNWTKSKPTDYQLGLEIAAYSDRYWSLRDVIRVGREWMKTFLDLTPAVHSQPRAMALVGLGGYCWRMGDYPEARAAYKLACETCRAIDNLGGLSTAIGGLANVNWYEGNKEAAVTLYEEALALAREANNIRMVSVALSNLGLVAIDQSEFARAKELFEESLGIRRETSDTRGMATVLGNLSNVAREQGDLDTALRLSDESLQIRRGFGDRLGISYGQTDRSIIAKRQGDLELAENCLFEALTLKHELGEMWGMAQLLNAVANLRGLQGRWERAVNLWGASHEIRERIGAGEDDEDTDERERLTGNAKQLLGERAFNSAWHVGASTNVDDAVTLALRRD